MNEAELGRALLTLDAVSRPPADTRALTDRILTRDRRRVRILTWLTVGTWLISAALVVFLLISFGFILPALAHVRDPNWPPTKMPLAPDVHERAFKMSKDGQKQSLEIALQMASVGITFAVGALALASLCTFWLVMATRRATLRQVNANLVEITEQLKQLRQMPPASGP
jgi:hypothetical protein